MRNMLLYPLKSYNYSSSSTTWYTSKGPIGTVEVHVGTCNEEGTSTGREEAELVWEVCG